MVFGERPLMPEISGQPVPLVVTLWWYENRWTR